MSAIPFTNNARCVGTYTITTIQDESGISPHGNLYGAYFGVLGGYEPSKRLGTGPTEAAAIADLLANYKAPWGEK